jgi:peptidoglycan hydrolase-like protein with peptidoglycan-binding domain
VVRVQRIVGTTADGVYGPNTKAKVLAWQKAKGIPADGVWGPQSEAAYKKVPTLPAKPKPVVKTTRFPLPSGHFYGLNDGTKWSHSGVQSADKAAVRRIQKAVGVSQDGVIGPITVSKIKYWQKRHGIPADGKVGANTWKKFAL